METIFARIKGGLHNFPLPLRNKLSALMNGNTQNSDQVLKKIQGRFSILHTLFIIFFQKEMHRALSYLFFNNNNNFLFFIIFRFICLDRISQH